MKQDKKDHFVSITYLFVALLCFLTNAGAYYSSAFTTYSVPSAGAAFVTPVGGL